MRKGWGVMGGAVVPNPCGLDTTEQDRGNGSGGGVEQCRGIMLAPRT